MNSIKDRMYRKEGVVKVPVDRIDEHDGKKNVCCKVDDLLRKEEETKVYQTFKPLVVTPALMQGVVLVVANGRKQNGKRKDGRKNRKEQVLKKDNDN